MKTESQEVTYRPDEFATGELKTMAEETWDLILRWWMAASSRPENPSSTDHIFLHTTRLVQKDMPVVSRRQTKGFFQSYGPEQAFPWRGHVAK